MNLEKRMYLINEFLMNKEEVLYSLEQYIEHCKTSEEETWSKSKRTILISMLHRFQTAIENRQIPEIKSGNWFYEYMWNSDGIKLELLHCDEIELNDEGEIESSTFSNEMTILEIKAEYLTVDEYSERYQVLGTTVRQWIRRGKIRSAKKIGRDWIIPELADKPKRGYEPVTYSWKYLSKGIVEKYPFLEECKSLYIRKNDTQRDAFDIGLFNQQGKVYKSIMVNTVEREKFELSLISEAAVNIEEWFQNIMYIPAKRNMYYLRGGKIIMENEIVQYEENIDELEKENLSINTYNTFHDEDGMYIWNFSATFEKNNFNENDEETENVVELNHGIVIPAETEFYSDDNIHSAYDSAYDLCDSISGDMQAAYATIGEVGEGIKPEIIKELEMDEADSYESSILYFDYIKYKNSEYLKTFLKLFDVVKEGIPSEYCHLAVTLLSWKNETETIKTFLTAGWKIKNVDSDAVVMYRKL